jgi:SpoVK/Ycf46/Vps4 family AAA+-type ATPase
VKRTSTAELDSTLSDRSFRQNNFKRKKHETSLSKLLQACEPQKPSELAVSKQKQNEISKWLRDRAMKKQSMLILSGPSGCGKTAAMKLLAKENGFDVIEWITPIDQAEDENSKSPFHKLKLIICSLILYSLSAIQIFFGTSKIS